MNIAQILANTKRKNVIEVIDAENAAFEIAEGVIKERVLLFDNKTPVISVEKYFIRISEDDAEAVIRYLLSNDCRLTVPNSQIKEAIRRLRYMPELQIDLFSELKKGQMMVNLKNKIYGIAEQSTIEMEQIIKFDYMINIEYIPNSKLSDAPNFKKFVKKSIGEEQLECLLRVIGYCLSSLTKGRKAFVFYGVGKTGKSTILNVIESVFPEGLVSHEPFFTMSGERAKSHYFGKKVNISRETSVKINRNEESFKSLISNEYTTGSEKFEKAKDFVPTLSFLFAGNADLEFSALDDELLDRLVYIMFNRKIKDEDIDLDLEDKLMGERDVIFSLALDSLKRLIDDKYDFKMSKEAEEHIRHRRMMIHSVELFLDEMTEVKEGASVSSARLLAAYTDFCHRNGIKPIGRNKFYEKVKNYASNVRYDRIPDSSNDNSSVHGFRNLKLNWNPEQDSRKES